MNEDNKGRVDRLSDTLYSRTRYKNPLDDRSPVRSTEDAPTVSEKWQSPELNELLTRERVPGEINPFMKKFFVFALFFFTATILVAGVIFLGGSNFVSSKNVDISVLGPTTASVGSMLELGVTITNDNNTDLEAVSFSVQYPQGAKDPTDTTRSLTFTKDDIGEIGAGDEEVRNVSLVLIGSTGEVKTLKFSVEYKIKGSNATFFKDKIYDITIGSAPITIQVESASTITSGDTFTTEVKIALHSADILKNVMLRAEYPYGYSVTSAMPEAVFENNVWALGDFAPGTEKTVKIQGRLVGENQDERTFRFYAGVSDNGSLAPDFKSVIITSQNTVAIQRPSIGLNVNFNGDSAPIYVAPAEKSITASIRYQNNLPEKLVNPRLEVVITGASLDRENIRVQNDGFYNSADNRVIWSVLNSSGVAELLPGQNGTVAFVFSSLPLNLLPTGNRDITLQLFLSGTPVGSKTILVKESRVVKIASQVSFTSKAYYSIGPFRNTGPIPPRVEIPTTYTAVLNIGNTQDDILDAKVTAKLGPGVSWIASQSAESENIAYDAASNTITWDLNNITSGSGFSTSGREVAFQVSLTPSLSQLGSTPNLVTNIVLSGRDSISGKTITVTNPALTTRLSNDPAYIQGDDQVRRGE